MLKSVEVSRFTIETRSWGTSVHLIDGNRQTELGLTSQWVFNEVEYEIRPN